MGEKYEKTGRRNRKEKHMRNGSKEERKTLLKWTNKFTEPIRPAAARYPPTK
jgi:hypothetical protein